MSRKYGYNASDVAAANQRQIAMPQLLTQVLETQRAAGSEFFVGRQLTALDFYWAAFLAIFAVLPEELCPFAPAARSMFETLDPQVKAAISPILLEHRERILHAHFVLPMAF